MAEKVTVLLNDEPRHLDGYEHQDVVTVEELKRALGLDDQYVLQRLVKDEKKTLSNSDEIELKGRLHFLAFPGGVVS